MSSPSLKQVESAVQTFWFEREEPKGKEQTELFNAFDPKGMAVYRRLLRNDWEETIESIYPLCQQAIGEEWTNVITRYIMNTPPEHFNLNQLAKKFASYLKENEKGLPPFLPELADFEWLELEIMEHPTIVNQIHESAPGSVNDFLELNPTVNPTLNIRSYSFDILEIAREIQQEDSEVDLMSLAKPSFVAAFRPPDRYCCEFLELINKTEAELLLKIMKTEFAPKYGELAKELISRQPNAAPETVSLQFINMVERFHEAGVFI